MLNISRLLIYTYSILIQPCMHEHQRNANYQFCQLELHSFNRKRDKESYDHGIGIQQNSQKERVEEKEPLENIEPGINQLSLSRALGERSIQKQFIFLYKENERKKEDKERKELVLRINYLIRLCLLLAWLQRWV